MLGVDTSTISSLSFGIFNVLNNAESVYATTFSTDFSARIRTWISTRRSAYQASWRKSTNIGSLVA
jgi:hypothetical protein